MTKARDETIPVYAAPNIPHSLIKGTHVAIMTKNPTKVAITVPLKSLKDIKRSFKNHEYPFKRANITRGIRR